MKSARRFTRPNRGLRAMPTFRGSGSPWSLFRRQPSRTARDCSRATRALVPRPAPVPGVRFAAMADEFGDLSRRECPEHGIDIGSLAPARRGQCGQCDRGLVTVEYLAVRADVYRQALELLRDARAMVAHAEPSRYATWRARVDAVLRDAFSNDHSE